VRSRARPIYVETFVRTSLGAVWDTTQDPDRHRRWDLRFSEIEYLPRTGDSEPQRFLYSTRIAPGLTIRGTGESVGSREGESGARTSALRFGSDDRRSLIRSGSGYWRYVPEPGGVRFLTRYDYEPRWGRAGRLIDRVLFRPLLGWATAWSFDRLRLWLEEGVAPEHARLRARARRCRRSPS
jgi:hypothetical protein